MPGIDRPVPSLDRLRVVAAREFSAPSPSPCGTCSVRAINLCAALLAESPDCQPLTQRHERAERRDIPFEAERSSDSIYLICGGWAFAFRRLRDGRRHILRFLVPGDLVSPFGEGNFSVQALTELRFCIFVAAEIKARMIELPQTFDAWMTQLAAERSQLAAAAVALGQFDAAERIAHLVLQLRERLEARGLMHGESFPFPLRQSHIADSTGLTSVHVSRTLTAFRKDGIFAIEDGLLKIADLPRLRRIVEGR